jgi:hypothetical protein
MKRKTCCIGDIFFFVSCNSMDGTIPATDRSNGIQSVREMASGRVDLLSPHTNRLGQLESSRSKSVSNSYSGALTGNWEDTLLSKTFFSHANIQILHNAMRAGVYEKSGGRFTIPEQNTDTVKVIMRGVFLQDAMNRPDGIRDQIEALNRSVVHHCVDQLYGEVSGYIKYKTDASTLITPIDLPIHISNTKTLEMKPW